MVSRSLEIDDLAPKEVAEIFCDLDGDQQAEFFACVWDIAKGWSGAGWCQQSYHIAESLGTNGQRAVQTLAGHVAAKTGWRPSEG